MEKDPTLEVLSLKESLGTLQLEVESPMTEISLEL